MPNEYELRNMITSAVNSFLQNDASLLNLKVYEPAISHRIAVYLEQELNNPDLQIDCEYNKHFNSPKTMSACKNIRPDIVIHKRNSDSTNLVAIEIKKSRKSNFDEQKLKFLTNQANDYRYALGAFIYFPKEGPTIKWFSSGAEIHFA